MRQKHLSLKSQGTLTVAEKSGIVVALAGNPNSGKTSLFNFITGSHQHVGNYPGVTVERKSGVATVDDAAVTFVDLPGTYSLSPFSIEEYVSRNEMLSPDISGVIVVVDTTRLERNLYLAAQIIEIGKPTVIALNMYDEFEDEGGSLNIPLLSEILGVPCIPTVGNRGKGVTELMATALKAVRGEMPAIGKPPRYSHEMEHAIDAVMDTAGNLIPFNPRWSAINLLIYGDVFPGEKDHRSLPEDILGRIDGIRTNLEHLEGRSVQNIASASRYGFVTGAVTECIDKKYRQIISATDRIDAVLTNRWLGLPIFLTILWLMFQATFSIGEMPVQIIGRAFDLLGGWATILLPDGFIRSLVVDGIIAGVGGVVMFLPNILILFFFISLLEDTGYMARSAFIMDRIMHFLGLHGKSFLPMLVGFGCTVPAIMATRILESRRERLITMFIIPFMSCGARLPVYILLTGAFFSREHAGTVIFSLYMAGMLLSFIVAKILSMMTPSPSPFVMELPPYRIPTPRSVLLHIWERAYMYLRKAGTVILMASVIVWFLVTFPGGPADEDVSGSAHGGRSRIEHTYAAAFGRFIEPVIRPLGFDWRIGVALTTGFAAKEIIVSTLGTIYSVGDQKMEDTHEGLITALRDDPTMNPVKAYGLMLFILIYVPCIAVLGVLRREAGGWKWVIIMITYTTSLAWLVSFLFIKTAELLM